MDKREKFVKELAVRPRSVPADPLAWFRCGLLGQRVNRMICQGRRGKPLIAWADCQTCPYSATRRPPGGPKTPTPNATPKVAQNATPAPTPITRTPPTRRSAQ